MNSRKNVYSVRQVNTYVRQLFEQDFLLKNICVKGEISNCKYHHSGHIYFSLKDESGVISAVMFASNAVRLSFHLTDGAQVIVHGTVSVYERDGRYQLYAKEIEEAGQGDLYRQFEELKERLSEMGMFAPEYKKPIPKYSMNIGVVTAETGAVIRDIYNVASRRNPYARITLYPATVQGEGAAATIVKGIETLDRLGLDVIIVGRGGGSIEDLWCFNEECVARAIFQCSTPVISAVGHETDFTIADFVADLRAPTPSAAAELGVFDYRQFLKDLSDIRQSLYSLMTRQMDSKREQIHRYFLQMQALSPEHQLRQKMLLLDELAGKIKDLMDRRIRDRKETLGIYAERLNGLSPLKRLSEGYSFVTAPDDKALTSISQVEPGEWITVHVTDGRITAEVLNAKKTVLK